MTVSSETRKAGPYAGDDVTTTFDFAFKVFADTDVYVVYTAASGVETVLVLNTDYSVALNADQDANPGGTITYPLAGVPLTTTDKITLTSDVPETQTTSLPAGGNWNPKTVEKRLDWLTVLTQQIKQSIGRALRYPLSDDAAGSELPTKAARLGKFLAFDPVTGDPMASDGSGAPASAYGATLIAAADAAAARTVLGAPASASTVLDGDAAGGDLTGTYPNPTIDVNKVTYAKMQDVSATSRLLGRVTAGAGDPEEVVLDTDTALATNSDARVASQKAVKAYVDGVVVPPGWTLLQSGNQANVATALIGDGLFTATYDDYMIVFSAKPLSGGAEYLKLSIKAGGAILTGALHSYYSFLKNGLGTDYSIGGNAGTFFHVTDAGVGTWTGATGSRVRGEIHVQDPTQTTEYPSLAWDKVRYTQNIGAPEHVNGFGSGEYRSTATAIQALQLAFSAGNGDFKWTLYGLKK